MGIAAATPESLPAGGVWWVSAPPVPDALRPARTAAPLRSSPGGLLGEVRTPWVRLGRVAWMVPFRITGRSNRSRKSRSRTRWRSGSVGRSGGNPIHSVLGGPHVEGHQENAPQLADDPLCVHHVWFSFACARTRTDRSPSPANADSGIYPHPDRTVGSALRAETASAPRNRVKNPNSGYCPSNSFPAREQTLNARKARAEMEVRSKGGKQQSQTRLSILLRKINRHALNASHIHFLTTCIVRKPKCPDNTVP